MTGTGRSAGRTPAMFWPAFILGYVAAHTAAGWLLADGPLRPWFAAASLLVPPVLLMLIVLRRRQAWAGCQQLFWIVIAAGAGLWSVGHAGWVISSLGAEGAPPWVNWHTVLSVSGGIAPLLALWARPHLGVRARAAGTTALDVGGLALVTAFAYAYFVLAPGFEPLLREEAQTSLLLMVQAQRLLLLAAWLAAVWVARRTAWGRTYARMAVGIAVGLLARTLTSLAIHEGTYQSGSAYDLAWVIPFLFTAWAAAEAPRSAVAEPAAGGVDVADLPPLWPLLAAVGIAPVIGYAYRQLAPAGPPVDGIRDLLTALATIAGFVLLVARVALQRAELQRADARVRLLATAIERTEDLILIVAADGRVEHANQAWLRAVGHTLDEVRGRPASALLAPESMPLAAGVDAEARARGVWRGTIVRRRRDGSTFPSACTVVPLAGPHGSPAHFVYVERDTSDDLRRRDQLIHAERMSAIGELVAGVAHELNNPLQTIVGCSELLLAGARDSDTRRDLAMVRTEATRAGHIVRNLLAFAYRSGSRVCAPADLNDIVHATIAMRASRLEQQGILVEVEASDGLPAVEVRRDEIQQLLMNLLLNAEHALAAWPHVRRVLVRTGLEGRRVCVDVIDSGPGVSPELARRIFEPFFTTRQVGQGTGLGLSSSLGIAQAHGGALELVPSAGGARFRLTLPALASSAAAGVGPSVRPAGAIDEQARPGS